MAGPMGLIYPVVGDTEDAWGSTLNTLLEAVEGHLHSPGSGNPIQSAALRINADVQWNYNGSYWALLQARALGLKPQTAASVASLRDVFYVDSANNNLYFLNHAGNPVRLTNGNLIDMSLLGGIVGDYAAVGAECAFVDSSDAYTFKQQGAAPKPWAAINAGNVSIFEQGTTTVRAVRLKSPAALAAGYDVTFPGALPAVVTPLQIDSSGQVSAPPWSLQAIVTPGANLAAGNNNDYAGLSTAQIVRFTGDVGAFLTGIAGGTSGRLLTMFNVGANDIVVTHDDGSSTAANRFFLANATASVTVRRHGSMTFWYDSTSSRWRVKSQNL